jgi:hypothetical protein
LFVAKAAVDELLQLFKSAVQEGCTYRKASDTEYQERDTFQLFPFLLPARDFRRVKSAEIHQDISYRTLRNW